MRLAIAGYACAAGRNYVIWVPRGRRRGSANRCPIIGEEARSLTDAVGSLETNHRRAWRAGTRASVGGVVAVLDDLVESSAVKRTGEPRR